MGCLNELGYCLECLDDLGSVMAYLNGCGIEFKWMWYGILKLFGKYYGMLI